MKKLILSLAILILAMGSAHANTGPQAYQVQTNCSTWTKNLNCTMTNQQLVDNVVDQITGGGGSSYNFVQSLVNSGGTVSLLNDTTSPGNSTYYGTNSSGTKGWFDLGTGSGSVTSVGLTGDGVIFNSTVTGSPITTTGTFVPSLLNQAKNTVFSGPSSGSNTTPSFRNLIGTDLPLPTATSLGGVQSISPTTHQWINTISTSGIPSTTQPNYTDITGQVPAITALTGDMSASGVGSQNATLATVNANVGSFTSANITVNAKGLVTAASSSAGGGSIAPGTPGQEAIYTGSQSIGSGFITDTGSTIGIGNTSPTSSLQVNSTWNIGIGTVSPPQSLSVNGNISMNGGISTAKTTDPINDWHAAGIVTTTTGSISSSSQTTTLTVASATGWTVGMGIDIAGAGSAGSDLITSVSAINGTIFTVANAASTTVSGALISHDDTVALQSAINSGKNVYIRAGQYNITSQLNVALPIGIFGDGSQTQGTSYKTGTVIWVRSTTANAFNISVSSVIIHDLSVIVDPSYTQTAGSAFLLLGTQLIQDYIYNYSTYGNYIGISLGSSATSGNVTACQIHDGISVVVKYGIYVHNTSPNGGLYFHDISATPVTANTGVGIYITNNDSTRWHSINMTSFVTDLAIDDSHGATMQQDFIGCNFENAGPSVTLSDASSNVYRISFVGGLIGVGENGSYGLEILNHVKDVTVTGVLFYDENAGIEVNTSKGYVTITGNSFSQIMYSPITILAGSTNVITSGNTYENSGLPNVYNADTTTTILDAGTNYVMNGGNVGIGTNFPVGGLDVEGNLPVSLFADSGSTSNVGIGSFSPGQKLDVQGTVRATNLTVTSLSTGCLTNTSGVVSSTGTSCGGSGGSSANPSATIGLSAVNGSATTFMTSDSAPPLGQNIVPTWTGTHTFNGSPAIITGANDNVGIGSTTPGQLLDVAGTVRATNFSGPGTGLTGTAASLSIGGNAATVTTNANLTGAITSTGNTVSNNFVANIGIGSSNPGSILDVNSSGNVGIGVRVVNPNAGTLAQAAFTVTNNAGNSGVFSVLGSNFATVPNFTQVASTKGILFQTDDATSTSGTDVMKITTGGYSNSATFTILGGNPGNVGIGTTLPSGLLEVGAQKFDVLAGGNVGIGSITPGQALDVQGTVRLSQSLSQSSPQTTVSCSSSGSVIFSEPFTGSSFKEAVFYANACVGTASYTYPTAFTNAPSAIGAQAALVTTNTTTSCTVTGTTSTGNGFLIGY